MEAQLHQGLVKISDYKALLQSELFSRMETFSNNFIAQNSETLSAYSQKWVFDSLHNWSRQWEYPFVFSEIEKYAAACTAKPIKILDAGSGITFFPYFLEETIHGVELTCCDTDESLQEIYKSINSHRKSDVKFLYKDIRNIGFERDSFNIIYCVSVLEHTSNYDEIIKEFVRLLKSKGILIVTFDISLDGRSDVSISGIRKILSSLKDRLSFTDKGSILRIFDEEELFSPDIVTTMFISDWNKPLLPWKYPLLSSLLASLKRRKLPNFGIKKLTFTCHTLRKKIDG